VSAPQEALEAVADAIGQVGDLNVYSYTPGAVRTPAAVCEIAAIDAPTALGGSVDYTIRVLLLVQRGDQQFSQEHSLDLADPTGDASTSVFAALLTLDAAGPVRYEPGTVEHGGTQYAGGLFTFDLYG
jgi:hypothetical protein